MADDDKRDDRAPRDRAQRSDRPQQGGYRRYERGSGQGRPSGNRDGQRSGGYRGDSRGGASRPSSDGERRYGRDSRDGGERRSGGYQGNRDSRDGGEPRSGGYQGRLAGNRDGQRSGGYRGDSRSGGASRGSGGGDGYRRYDRDSRDGGERRSGGYQGNRDSRDGGERRSGGYQGRPSGGRDGQRSGGYRGDSRGGSRPAGDREGYRRYDRDSRDGGDRGGFRRDSVRRDDRRTEREDGSRRGDRSTNRPAIEVPEIPEEISIGQLDRTVRARLRTLSKDNAEDVGRHLVMAGLFMEIDPERAYKHAQVAAQRAGRVDVVREAAALTAYATGRYAEALRELRTVRRLNGSHEHLPLMADCERGLGRPERAIALSREPESAQLDPHTRVELAIVVAGARVDMGDAEAALVALGRLETKDADLAVRISGARVEALRALGRVEEADALAATLPVPAPVEDPWADEITLYDVAELPELEDEVSVVDDDARDGDGGPDGDADESDEAGEGRA